MTTKTSPPAACSGRLLHAAKKAARAAAKAQAALNEWAALFEEEYGHTDIADALVEVIDYSTGSTDMLTRQFIAEHSIRGES